MRKEHTYPLIPICVAAALWVLWSVTLGFENGFSFLSCAAFSIGIWALLMYFFCPTAVPETGHAAPESEGAVEDEWIELINRIKDQIKLFAGTPVEAHLQTLHENLKQINRAIKLNPDRAKNSVLLRRFHYVCVELQKDLVEYDAVRAIQNPGPNVRNIRAQAEEHMSKLSAVSKEMVDYMYKWSSINMSIDNPALEEMIRSLSGDGGISKSAVS